MKYKTVILYMLTAALTTGCASPVTPVPTTAATTTIPSATSTTAASKNLNGAHVSVLGLWSGPELDSFMAVKANIEAKNDA